MKFGDREAVKVICDGWSFHGGYHKWSPPTKRDDGTWDAGEWTDPVKPSLCNSGYHLTREPA